MRYENDIVVVVVVFMRFFLCPWLWINILTTYVVLNQIIILLLHDYEELIEKKWKRNEKNDDYHHEYYYFFFLRKEFSLSLFFSLILCECWWRWRNYSLSCIITTEYRFYSICVYSVYLCVCVCLSIRSISTHIHTALLRDSFVLPTVFWINMESNVDPICILMIHKGWWINK